MKYRNRSSHKFGSIGKLLDLDLNSESDIVLLLRKGVPAKSCQRFQKRIGFSGALIGSKARVHQRLNEGKQLGIRESERLVRLARISALAIDLFGEESAKTWLNRPSLWLPHEPSLSPLALAAESEAGAQLIESRLAKTQHGVY